ncbi:hypothetical protein JCM5350_006665 [Sporobolomyces pararoseus]
MDEESHKQYIRDLKSFALVHSTWKGWAQELLIGHPRLVMLPGGDMRLRNQVSQRLGEGDRIKGLTLSAPGDLETIFRDLHTLHLTDTGLNIDRLSSPLPRLRRVFFERSVLYGTVTDIQRAFSQVNMPRLDTLSLDMSYGIIGAHAEFDKRYINIFPQIRCLAINAPVPLLRWSFSSVLDSLSNLVNLQHLSLVLVPKNFSDWVSLGFADIRLVTLHLQVDLSMVRNGEGIRYMVDALAKLSNGVSLQAEKVYLYGDWSCVGETPEYISMSSCWREGNAPFSNFEEYPLT